MGRRQDAIYPCVENCVGVFLFAKEMPYVKVLKILLENFKFETMNLISCTLSQTPLVSHM